MKLQVQTLAQQRRRARRQARARRTRPRRLAARLGRLYRARQVAVRRREPIYDYIIRAPDVLSFTEAPDATLVFLEKLRTACRPGQVVMLDLRPVEKLTNCAILLLQSKLLDDTDFTRRAEVYARPPLAVGPARIWQESLRGPGKSDNAWPLDRALILGRNRFRHKKVEVAFAAELVQRAMHYLSGTPQSHHAAYRTLVECMSNTFKHADPAREATENWWVASYPHPGPGPRRWCFAFVDNGVGILESLTIKGFFKRLRHLFGLVPNHETLQQLMEGQIGSRLGLSYRGKGLPGIYTELERGRIHNLVIVTNDICANFATKDYVNLTKPFGGTFLYWELSLPPQTLTP